MSVVLLNDKVLIRHCVGILVDMSIYVHIVLVLTMYTLYLYSQHTSYTYGKFAIYE